MTILSKISTFILALGFILVVASCGKDDDCYECAAFTDSFGNELPALDFCEGDAEVGSGAAFNLVLTGYETAGYDCKKK